MKNLSIIITSLKDNPKTLDSLDRFKLRNDVEIIISMARGLGLARNNGVKLSFGRVLIFLDSDLVLNRNIWRHLINVKKNHFVMAFGGLAHGSLPEPITQVLAINRKDFDKVGFSEKIVYSGEDREFFLNAIKKGLIPIRLNKGSFYRHIDHPIRFKKNKMMALRFMFEHSKILVYHGAYIRNYKGFIRWFFPFLYLAEKKTIRQYIAKIFYSNIRNICVLYNLIVGVKL